MIEALRHFSSDSKAPMTTVVFSRRAFGVTAPDSKGDTQVVQLTRLMLSDEDVLELKRALDRVLQPEGVNP